MFVQCMSTVCNGAGSGLEIEKIKIGHSLSDEAIGQPSTASLLPS